MKVAFSTGLLTLCAICIVMASVLVAPWPFLFDEVLYIWSAYAMAEGQTLLLENGYDALGLDALTFGFLRNGPNGLTSQYPVGTAVLGGPLYALFGARGLVILNAVAAALTLFLVRGLARRLFDDNRVALLSVLVLLVASFWLEYAFGLWPHAICVALVTAAFVSAFRMLEAERSSVVSGTLWALVSGLAVSAAFLMRYDSILALPPIGVLVLLYSAHPLRLLLAGALGVVPGFAFSSLANAFKFGTWSPVSYGVATGGVDPRSYFVFLALLIGIAILVLLIRFAPKAARIAWIGAIAALLVSWVFIPQVASIAWRLLDGIAALLIDTRFLPDDSPGLVREEAGGVLIFGMAKKAIGQSLPWVGLFILLVLRPWPPERRRAYAFIVLATAVWTFPFLVRSWHGGLGSNMRYFLPLVPLLAILCARLLIDLGAATRNGRRGIFLGVFGGLGLGILWLAISANPTAKLSLGSIALTIVVLAAGASAFPGRFVAQRNAFGLIGGSIGLGVSVLFGVMDLRDSQVRRAWVGRVNADLAQRISEPSLIISYVPHLVFQIPRPQGLLGDRLLDGLGEALDAGYALWVSESYVPMVRATTPGLIAGERIEHEGGTLFRLLRMPEAE